MTLAQAAKVAGLSVEEFVSLLGGAGIPAVDYAPRTCERTWIPSGDGVVVADAGPLIGVARAGRLELLQKLYESVWIPPAVR